MIGLEASQGCPRRPVEHTPAARPGDARPSSSPNFVAGTIALSRLPAERAAEKLFALAPEAVNVGGVEEVDARIQSGVHNRGTKHRERRSATRSCCSRARRRSPRGRSCPGGACASGHTSRRMSRGDGKKSLQDVLRARREAPSLLSPAEAAQREAARRQRASSRPRRRPRSSAGATAARRTRAASSRPRPISALFRLSPSAHTRRRGTGRGGRRRSWRSRPRARSSAAEPRPASRARHLTHAAPAGAALPRPDHALRRLPPARAEARPRARARAAPGRGRGPRSTPPALRAGRHRGAEGEVRGRELSRKKRSVGALGGHPHCFGRSSTWTAAARPMELASSHLIGDRTHRLSV